MKPLKSRPREKRVSIVYPFFFFFLHLRCVFMDCYLEKDASLTSVPSVLQRSSLGPMVGLPIQKRGRLGGRSGDLLGVRPSDKVHEFHPLDFYSQHRYTEF